MSSTTALDYPEDERKLLRRIGRRVRTRLAANPAVQTVVSDRAEVWAVSGFFDPSECGRLMTIIDRTARPSGEYRPAGEGIGRTSFSADLDEHDPFIEKLDRRFDDLLGLEHRTGEFLEGQRYHAGQFFRPHTDWFPPGSPGWQTGHARGGQRAFTAMAYLNMVESGGETDFPRLDIAVRPQPGALLIWNNADRDGLPNKLTVHSGNPVLRGHKYVVTKWYRCGYYR